MRTTPATAAGPESCSAHVMRKAQELSWPLRRVIAGAAGTTAMTLAYAAEHHVRVNVKGQLDYDDGLVPGQIVATISTCRRSRTASATSSGSGCAGATGRRSGCCTARCAGPSASRSRAPPSVVCS